MRPIDSAICVRTMSAADIGRVMEIAASLPFAPQWPFASYANVITPDSARHRIALVAVGRESNIPTGFAVASLVPPEAELETIAVAGTAQRQGVGVILLQALVHELREHEVAELNLEVRASNGGALGLYRTQGFEETGRRRRYYAEPEEDAILMHLRVS